MQSEIVVSVICNAYNHEPYIAQCLESMVMQNTNFAYEVLVHDDASTDKTADIIREYEQKYPDIIKPIYQTENQYSKGSGMVGKIQFSRVKGRYIAFCEGDDYWTDPLKLQKQFDAMEAHPELDICAHAALMINATTGKEIRHIAPKNNDTVISTDEVILGEGGYVATNSLFYRTELCNHAPEFRKILSIDYSMQIYGSLRGGMLYLADCMSVYRYLTAGSWTVRTQENKEKYLAFQARKRKMLLQLNKDTDGKYNDAIAKVLLLLDYDNAIVQDNYKEILTPKYKSMFNTLSKSQRIKIRIKAAFPFLHKLKRLLKSTSK